MMGDYIAKLLVVQANAEFWKLYVYAWGSEQSVGSSKLFVANSSTLLFPKTPLYPRTQQNVTLRAEQNMCLRLKLYKIKCVESHKLRI